MLADSIQWILHHHFAIDNWLLGTHSSCTLTIHNNWSPVSKLGNTNSSKVSWSTKIPVSYKLDPLETNPYYLVIVDSIVYLLQHFIHDIYPILPNCPFIWLSNAIALEFAGLLVSGLSRTGTVSPFRSCYYIQLITLGITLLCLWQYT